MFRVYNVYRPGLVFFIIVSVFLCSFGSKRIILNSVETKCVHCSFDRCVAFVWFGACLIC